MPTEIKPKRDYYNKIETDNRIKELLKEFHGIGVEKVRDYYNKLELDAKLKDVLSNTANKYVIPNIQSENKEIKSGRFDCSDLTNIKPTYINLINFGNIPGKNRKSFLSKEFNIKDHIESLEKCIIPSNNSYGYVINTENGAKTILNSSVQSRNVETHSLTFYNLVWNTDTSVIFYWNQFTVDSFINFYLQIEYTKTTDTPVSIDEAQPSDDVDLSNYYTKAEVNQLLDNISVGGGGTSLVNYYTKSEVDNKLTSNYNSSILHTDTRLENYYDKSQLTNILNNSLNKYYDKVYIDETLCMKMNNDEYLNAIGKKGVPVNIGKFRVASLDETNDTIVWSNLESIYRFNYQFIDGMKISDNMVDPYSILPTYIKNYNKYIIIDIKDFIDFKDNYFTFSTILGYKIGISKNQHLTNYTYGDEGFFIDNFYICDDGTIFKIFINKYSGNDDKLCLGIMSMGDEFESYYMTSFEVTFASRNNL